MKPYKAQLKFNGQIEVYDINGDRIPDLESSFSKEKYNALLKLNNMIHLEGFDNADSRMKGVENG